MLHQFHERPQDVAKLLNLNIVCQLRELSQTDKIEHQALPAFLQHTRFINNYNRPAHEKAYCTVLLIRIMDNKSVTSTLSMLCMSL